MTHEPQHGYCEICKGPINEGWTLTANLRRVHANPDDCIAILEKKTNMNVTLSRTEVFTMISIAIMEALHDSDKLDAFAQLARANALAARVANSIFSENK